MSPFRLDGVAVLVTGCRRGIGKAIAEAVASAGANPVIGISAHLERDGGDVAREVEARGANFVGYKCDLGRRDELYGIVESLSNDGIGVDVLINNAGTIRRTPASLHSDDDWDDVLEVNLSSQFILTRELGKGMLERGRGKVVFVASLLSFQGGINVPGYAASKGGVAQLTKALANEWAERGVNVNAVAPGYIATDQTQVLRDDRLRAAQILERIPAGRWGKPEDIAGAVVFLASRASDYVSGVILPVDGGWLAR
jgi:2-deoxy-D-gluconate 3-dehydrogenase